MWAYVHELLTHKRIANSMINSPTNSKQGVYFVLLKHTKRTLHSCQISYSEMAAI
uniref:Uncharacterized protein n=1 Tax=Manihot esculenta TaxID=3983 RepID=A0A2C9W6M0_MANES